MIDTPLAQLCRGGKAALARALAALEADSGSQATLALLDAAWAQPKAHVIGLTGPPGVGKSTLGATLVRHWRKSGRSVGLVAVDPSSRRSGGALLGDRTRLDLDPDDDGVFFRSMAARERLGGIAALTAGAVVLMRALYDLVLVETVGVGQSETDVADVVDTVVLAVQPGSGDSLQYMKAGIVELPHIAVVTKADLGEIAARTRRDLEAALSMQPGARGGWRIPVLVTAAAGDQGTAQLAALLELHIEHLERAGLLEEQRAQCALRWLTMAVRDEFGRRGAARVRIVDADLLVDSRRSPFRRLAEVTARLGEGWDQPAVPAPAAGSQSGQMGITRDSPA